jgi:hypothetical protein
MFFPKKPYTLEGLEPGIFGSVGVRGDHYTRAKIFNHKIIIILIKVK